MKNRFLLLLLFMGVWVSATAQDTLSTDGFDQTDVIQNEVIEVVKLYEPILADAKKIKLVPDLKEQEVAQSNNASNPVFNDYQVPNRFLSLTFEPPGLKPLALKKKRPESLYNAWLKAGYGNYNTPLIDFSVSTGRPSENSLGLQLQHLSSRVPENYQQDFMNNLGKAFGNFYFGKNYLNVSLAGEYDQYFYYGYDWTDSTNYPLDEDVKINTLTIPISVELGSAEENNANVFYKFGLDYHFFNTNWNTKENQVGYRLDLEKRFDNRWLVGIDSDANFTTYEDSLKQGENSLETFALNAVPYVGITQPWGKLRLGVNLGVDQNDFLPYPDLQFAVHLIEKQLTLYGGWNKEVIKNNARNMTEQNPFLRQTPFYLNSVKESRFVGFSGNVGSNFMFDLKGGQYITDKQPLFINMAVDPAQFTIIYDSMLTTLGGVASLSYIFNEQNSISASFQYLGFSAEDETEGVWHIAPIEFNLSGTWEPIPKLKLRTDFIVYSGVEARAIDGTVVNLDAILDWNIGAQYWFGEKFAMFLDGNNLLNRKTARFLNYPRYGLNAIGGIQYRF